MIAFYNFALQFHTEITILHSDSCQISSKSGIGKNLYVSYSENFSRNSPTGLNILQNILNIPEIRNPSYFCY